MKVSVFLLILVALVGCGDDHKKDIARCQVEGHKIYPGKGTSDYVLWRFLVSCMEAAGYEFRAGFGLCSQHYMVADPTCWHTPTERRIAWLISLLASGK